MLSPHNPRTFCTFAQFFSPVRFFRGTSFIYFFSFIFFTVLWHHIRSIAPRQRRASTCSSSYSFLYYYNFTFPTSTHSTGPGNCELFSLVGAPPILNVCYFPSQLTKPLASLVGFPRKILRLSAQLFSLFFFFFGLLCFSRLTRGKSLTHCLANEVFQGFTPILLLRMMDQDRFGSGFTEISPRSHDSL